MVIWQRFTSTLCCAVICLGPASFATAAPPLSPNDEQQSLMTTPGKTLVSEGFPGDTMPATFRTLATPASFRVVEAPGDSFATGPGARNACAFMVKAHDLTVAFSVKFIKAGTLYIGVDGYKEEFKGNTHLVRFALTRSACV